MSEKRIYLIRGLSGSGKTTFAEEMCEGRKEGTYELFAADDYFYGDDGEYVFEPDELKDSHEDCQARVKEACLDGVPLIIVHNTFTRAWECEPYFRAAKRNGYSIRVINLYDGGMSNEDLAEKCVHGVNAHAISRQRDRWELNVYPRGHRGQFGDRRNLDRRRDYRDTRDFRDSRRGYRY